MMQLAMNFDIFSVAPVKNIIQTEHWIDVTPEARMIGFSQKVKISQQFSDALRAGQFEDDDTYEQRVYDATWLAHHYFSIDKRASFSFTFDYLLADPIASRLTERSIRLRLEIRSDTALLGLLNDF